MAQQRFVRPVLDVGCGEGLFAWTLFQEPVDTGIDPNDRELAHARQLGQYTELIQCRGDCIPKPDESYQTIFSNSVFEHIADLRPVIKEMYRLLAPGGILYITVPSHLFDRYSVVNQILETFAMATLSKQYRAFFNRFWRHHHYYEPTGWHNVFCEAGFEVNESYMYGPKGLCLLNDLLLPFSLPSMILKKMFNRWTLFPGVRRLVLAPFMRLVETLSANAIHVPNGGLVFLKLCKPPNGQVTEQVTATR